VDKKRECSRFRGVVQIDLTCSRIKDYILENCTEHFGGAVNVWFGFGGQLDDLRVTTAFKIKYTMSDHPCSSSPTSCRSGSAESVVLPVPERPKKTATSPFSPTLAETVHAHHPLLRQEVVRIENTLFLVSPA
jgi:hypothetical protein